MQRLSSNVPMMELSTFYAPRMQHAPGSASNRDTAEYSKRKLHSGDTAGIT